MEKNLILSRAKSAAIARDFQTAIRLYKMILKEDASNTEILNQIGSSYVKLGDDEKALLYYEQILTFSPHDVNAMNSMGAIYRRLKKYNDSINVLQKALDEDVNTATVNYNLGFTYKEMGNYDDAISAFQSVVEENPEDVLAHNHMGTIYYQKKEYQKSIACFKKGLQVDPNHPILQYNLAKCYEAENQYSEAVRCYEAALKARPGWLDALRDFSELLIKCQKTEEARVIVKRTIELNPNDARLYMLLGEVYLNEFDYDSAISTFNEADNLESNNVRILKDLAEALENGEEPQEAVAVMDKILKLDPENIDAKKQFVHTLLTAEEYEQAYNQVDTLYKENGEDDAQILDLYGQYYICVDDEENAKKYFDKIPTVDPKYSLYLLEAANRYSQIGKIHQAEELAKKYITKNPKDIYAHNSLGKIYTKKGDTEAAGAAFQKVIDYSPNNVYAKKQLIKLNKYRGKTENSSQLQPDNTSTVVNTIPDSTDDLLSFSEIISKAQQQYEEEQSEVISEALTAEAEAPVTEAPVTETEAPITETAEKSDAIPENSVDLADAIENQDIKVSEIPEEKIIQEKDQYLDEISSKDIFDEFPKVYADSVSEEAQPVSKTVSENPEVTETAKPAEKEKYAASAKPAEAAEPIPEVVTEAEAPSTNQVTEAEASEPVFTSPEDFYNAASQAADKAMEAAQKAVQSLQDIDEKFAEQQAILQDKFNQQEEELERKTQELIDKKDGFELTDEEKLAEEEFLDLDGFMDAANNLDEQPESEENNKNLSEENYNEEEKEFENAESDIIIESVPEKDSEIITEGEKAVEETLDFSFDTVDSFVQADTALDDILFDSVDSYLQADISVDEDLFDSVDSYLQETTPVEESDFGTVDDVLAAEEIETLDEEVVDELLSVDENSIDVNIVNEDAPFEDIISAAAEVAAESNMEAAKTDDNLDVLEEDEFSVLDPMETVRRYLPNLEKILQDTDYAHAHSTELDLFIKMKKFCEFLPASELDNYRNSKIRMLLDYLIARFSGKPGLLVTTQSLLKAGVLGEGLWDEIYEKEVNLPMEEEVRIVLEYMKKMTEGLTSKHVAQALCAEADKVLEQLELKKI